MGLIRYNEMRKIVSVFLALLIVFSSFGLVSAGSADQINKQTDPIAEAERVLGDINADGLVNVLDATEIQKYLSQLANLTKEELKRCDFNGDGIVSVIDSTEIQKYLAQI